MQIREKTPIQPIYYTKIFITTAEQMGASREDLLAAAEIEESIFSDHDALINYHQYRNLYKKAAESVNNPALFLSYGKNLGFTGHGQLGTAVFSSPSFEGGLLKISKYIKILARTYDFNVSFAGNKATISIDSRIPDKELYTQEIEQLISGIFHCIKIMPGNTTNMKAVHLSYPKPTYSSTYQELFGNICQFDCPNNEIVFSTEEINRYWILGNPEMEKVATKYCEEAIFQMESLPLLSNRILRTLNNHMERLPNQTEVAKTLGIPLRTMVRHLDNEKTSYKAIVDKLRKDKALYYLSSTSLSVEDISEMLSYSSASNFGRAFKKWTGESPSQYRETLVLEQKTNLALS